jgi:hypothetical protein
VALEFRPEFQFWCREESREFWKQKIWNFIGTFGAKPCGKEIDVKIAATFAGMKWKVLLDWSPPMHARKQFD